MLFKYVAFKLTIKGVHLPPTVHFTVLNAPPSLFFFLLLCLLQIILIAISADCFLSLSWQTFELCLHYRIELCQDLGEGS